jgi:CRP-like cAMP-binding protein
MGLMLAVASSTSTPIESWCIMPRNDSHDLRELPVFATLPRRARALANTLVTPVTFADGDVLCEEGHVGREAFVIVSGAAVVSRGDEVLAMVGPGDVVGELALLGDGRRTASVTATEPVEALVMSAQEFHSVLALPGVDEAIRRIAAEHAATAPAA